LWITAIDFGIEQAYYQRLMKRCPRCGETKARSEFHLNRVRRDGLQSICKSCRAVIDRERYERQHGTRTKVSARTWERGRTAWMLSLKTDRPCTDCGKVFPPQVMQWDHIPGHQKLGDISTGFRWRSRHEILDEIAKCELVCANCHAIRTFARAEWADWSRTMAEPVARYLCDARPRKVA
jgi:hypothetical protein